MGVNEIPQKYRTSDGREFNTKSEAEQYDAILIARDEYKAAQRKLGLLLVQSQKTADGRPFEFGRWGDYYYINPYFNEWPTIETVSFWGWRFEFAERDGCVLISHERNGRWESYRIDALYADKDAAERALLDAREARLAERAAEVAELRARLGPRATDEGR